jgi:hypothetical protein
MKKKKGYLRKMNGLEEKMFGYREYNYNMSECKWI